MAQMETKETLSATTDSPSAPPAASAARQLASLKQEWYAKAQAHQRAGELKEAEALYRHILSFEPTQAEVLSRLGTVRLLLGNREDCVIYLGLSLHLNPKQVDTLNNRGIALRGLRRHDEALASYDAAIKLKPDYAEAYNNRGNILLDLRRYEDALASFDHALELKSNYGDAHNGRGRALSGLKRPAEAIRSFDQAIAINPNHADAHNNRGFALAELRDHEAALNSFDQAAAINPNHVSADLSRGMMRMLKGDYQEGWRHYERWRVKQKRGRNHGFEQQLWTGVEPIADKTILLWGEQGLGDEIQFSRYATLLAEMGAKVILEVHPHLKQLLATMPIANDFTVIGRGDPVPPFDWHASVVSLPLHLGANLENIPFNRRYVFPDQRSTAQWARRVEQHSKRQLRVGLVWAGSEQLALDAQRSIEFALLEPLLKIPNVSFYSLQKGDKATEQLRAHSLGNLLVDWTAELNDFSDTAALIDNLDLVIGVDTSVMHLAGALGKPAWLLNRLNTCWRWLLEREDSPWYASMRIFRQTTQDEWPPVIEQASEALRKMLPGTKHT